MLVIYHRCYLQLAYKQNLFFVFLCEADLYCLKYKNAYKNKSLLYFIAIKEDVFFTNFVFSFPKTLKTINKCIGLNSVIQDFVQAS